MPPPPAADSGNMDRHGHETLLDGREDCRFKSGDQAVDGFPANLIKTTFETGKEGGTGIENGPGGIEKQVRSGWGRSRGIDGRKRRALPFRGELDAHSL